MSNDQTGGPRKRRQSVTIHDVAKHAGVSSMTASRAVNSLVAARAGNTKQYISDEMRKRVLASVEALGYKPNLAARAARSGTVQIGLLYSNPNSSNLGPFLMGAFVEATNLSCQLLVEPTAIHTDMRSAVKKLISEGAEALILPPPLCDDEPTLRHLRKQRVGAVSFTTADPRQESSAVMVDDLIGAGRMTRYLIDLGHRDIAFIRGDQQHSTAKKREEGFRRSMANAGLPVREEWVVDGDFSYRSGLAAGRALLEDPKHRPTAIFASNDDMATAVIAVAHGLDIDIPGELSIAGFDDTPVATTVWPELTTIHQPISQMAGTAVRQAMESIRSYRKGDLPRAEHHFAELELVERATTARPPVSKPATRKQPTLRKC